MSYFTALNPMNLVNALPGCIAQGVIWGIMALGVYVTFRLLDFADLTVDGSFATGGAVTVMLTLAGVPIPAALIALLYWYFGTEQGCSIRATGCNQSMSKANGININFTKVLALALSNGLVGLAGGLMAQYQGFSDINMGRGAIVIGLAAVIIGEVLGESILRKRLNFALRLVFVVMGGIIYYVVVGIVLWLKLNSNDLKLFTAIIVAVFLAVPYLQGRSKNSFARTAKASLAALQARKDKED